MKVSRFVAFFVFTVLLSVHHPVAADEMVEESEQTLDGITRAISDIQLSFVQPGKISEILVQEGDLVRIGDVLMRQADEIEAVQLKIFQSRSGNTLPIRLAEIDLLQKRKDLESIRAAEKKGAVTRWEVDHAVLAVDTALLTAKIREFEQQQDSLKLESIKESIKRLTLVSPLEGTVEEISIEPGETVQALAPVIRVVGINPLRIDLPVPVERAKGLSPRQNATIGFTDGTEQQGQIVKISSVADAAASTLEVKIEVPNPTARPAGERVTVVFLPKG